MDIFKGLLIFIDFLVKGKNRLGHKGFRAKTKELPNSITPLWWEEVGTNLQRTCNL